MGYDGCCGYTCHPHIKADDKDQIQDHVDNAGCEQVIEVINALYGLELETGDLSRKIERGKNTTRRCELIPVSGGGMVLDTPGFSLLDTPLMEPEKLKELYPEFAPYEGKCFFSPCLHAHEPKCAARDAVAEGDARRHGRYVEFLEETKKRWKERYG